MKKLMLFSFLALLLVSCSDDSSDSNKSDFFNRWYNVSTETNDVEVPYEHKPCAKDYIDFNPSGVFRSYTVLECDGSDVSDFVKETGTYSRSAGIVTISPEGKPERTAKIKKLTATELTLIVMDGDEEIYYNYTSVP